MSKIHNWPTRKYVELQDREEGQGLVEYGLILAFVAIAAVGAMVLLGGAISASFSDFVEAAGFSSG